MPSTGMPRSKIAGSARWAPGSYTLRGPPERMIPFGERRRISPAEMEAGTISERTRHSRTRRAMSWAYWAPKSTTRTVSNAGVEWAGWETNGWAGWETNGWAGWEKRWGWDIELRPPGPLPAGAAGACPRW